MRLTTVRVRLWKDTRRFHINEKFIFTARKFDVWRTAIFKRPNCELYIEQMNRRGATWLFHDPKGFVTTVPWLFTKNSSRRNILFSWRNDLVRNILFSIRNDLVMNILILNRNILILNRNDLTANILISNRNNLTTNILFPSRNHSSANILFSN